MRTINQPIQNFNPDSLNRDHGMGVSNRYKVIKTGDLVKAFQDQGYQVTKINGAGVRKAELQGFQKHVIRMRHPNMALTNDGLFPEIILKNSYNGTSCFEIMMGVFRLVCSNGLVVGRTYTTLKVRHVGEVLPKVLEACQRIQSQTEMMQSQINSMMGKQMSQSEMLSYASQVAKLLLPKPEVGLDGQIIKTVSQVNASDLLNINRTEDQGQDLWTILNRIQENAIFGGLRYQSVDFQGRVRNNTVRSIRSIDRSLQVNQAVWDSALEFLGQAA
jgi:hypothetical protein